MNAISAYVIGLRVNPDRAGPEWYSLWFEHPEGGHRLVANEGRLQWSSSIDGALALSALLDGQVSVDPPEFDGLCDVASTLYEVASLSPGKEAAVLNCLNLLDDMLLTVGHSLPSEPKLRLDRVSGRLTEGTSLPEVVLAHGGTAAVIEAVLASLGRVFVWSDFIRSLS